MGLTEERERCLATSATVAGKATGEFMGIALRYKPNLALSCSSRTARAEGAQRAAS
jgi:hypothetical protein